MMLLAGMVTSALAFGVLLADFSELRLIQVIQGSAVITVALNIIALWKQEPRDPSRNLALVAEPTFGGAWRDYMNQGERSKRRLVLIGVGTAAFSMEDILLEPYGGQILHLSVGATTALTAMLALGSLAGLSLAARRLNGGADPYRVSASGALVGIVAFTSLIFAAPMESALLFGLGTALIGVGAGLFAHGTLTASMNETRDGGAGIALGAWGAVQASAAGLAIALGGAISDGAAGLAAKGLLGPGLNGPATGYVFVYLLEIAMLFVTLAVAGPLVRQTGADWGRPITKHELVEASH
jgi:BCD family chlorophyll transporter-like MFS transporter